MENQRSIIPKSLKHLYTFIYPTKFGSSETETISPRIREVSIHLKCDTITDNWVTDQQTRHRLPSDRQSRTTKTTYPVVEKGTANLASFKNAIKELNRWLSPDGNPILMLSKEIKIDMLCNANPRSYSPPKDIVLHLVYKIVIRQDAIIFVDDVTDWVLQRSMEESGPKMVPASDSSIKSLRRMIVVDGNADDDGGCESCSICCEDFLAGSEVSCLPCSHVFHQDCIGKWLSTSRYCPNCRYEMPTN